MLEFGSDFHFCSNLFSNNNDLFFANKEVMLLANGRQALQYLIRSNKWDRMWVPAYFCYEIIESIKQTGITVQLYEDSPIMDDTISISKLRFKKNDVLLRMNYFGLRSWRDNSHLDVPVIEDHSHDLLGNWVEKSNADWCIASLRKTLPIPEGGMLWSPRKHSISNVPESTIENELLTYKRLSAMLMKTLYLSGDNISKDDFRTLFVDTENEFDQLSICSIAKSCADLLNQFNIKEWYDSKQKNWLELSTIQSPQSRILVPENIEECNPFSLILMLQDSNKREEFREKLIENKIYPAILWNIPPLQNEKGITQLGETLISIHCDGRYNKNQMTELKSKLLNITYLR